MTLLLFILSFGLIVVANANLYSEVIIAQWREFKLKHSKAYKNAYEDKLRMNIFMENMKLVAEHNQLYEMGGVSYDLAINEFSDMTENEFIAEMTGYNSSHLSYEKPITFQEPENFTIPDSIDWREKAVTEVKNQGRCGSCWSFSTTGSLEGQHFKKTGKLISMSEQNLIDCSSHNRYHNNGCHGGLMTNAFKYIKENGGIDSEKSYPYQGTERKCRYKQSNSVAKVKGFVQIEHGSERQLTIAAATVGPISVAIEATKSLMHYHSGVYYNPACSASRLNHAVLVVGYGSDNGKDYYIVKNSWGKSFGMAGYVNMARNRNDNCGISQEATYPVV